MVCETPKNCLGSTHSSIPPLEEGECEVKTFEAPLSLLQRDSDADSTIRVPVSTKDGDMVETRHVDMTMMSKSLALPAKASQTADQRAFNEWTSAVHSAEWLLDGLGNFVSQPPIAVPDLILKKKNESCLTCNCAFVNQFSLPANCDIEANSRLMVVKWIPKNATVLEVGARYGSVSCAISRVLANSGLQVSMDADELVWDALEDNRRNLKCNFSIARGLLGEQDGKIYRDRYGTAASTENSFKGNTAVTVPHFTVEDLESKHNLVFDTANFDCEGCFAPAAKAFPSFLQQLRLLIVEVHDEPEMQAVTQLLGQGWQLIDSHSRQYVIKNSRI
jgi:FkbM family methyltransferase